MMLAPPIVLFGESLMATPRVLPRLAPPALVPIKLPNTTFAVAPELKSTPVPLKPMVLFGPIVLWSALESIRTP